MIWQLNCGCVHQWTFIADVQLLLTNIHSADRIGSVASATAKALLSTYTSKIVNTVGT